MYRDMHSISTRAKKYKALLNQFYEWNALKTEGLTSQEIQLKMKIDQKRYHYIRTKKRFIERNESIINRLTKYMAATYPVELIVNKLKLTPREVFWLIEVYELDKQLYTHTFNVDDFFHIKNRFKAHYDLSREYHISLLSVENLMNMYSVIEAVNTASIINKIKLNKELAWTDVEVDLFKTMMTLLYQEMDFTALQISQITNIKQSTIIRYLHKKSIKKLNENVSIRQQEYLEKIYNFEYGDNPTELLASSFLLTKKQIALLNRKIKPIINEKKKERREILAKKIEEMALQKMTSKQIAKKLNLSFNEVQSIRNSFNIRATKGSAKKYSFQLIQSIADYYLNKYMNYSEIATILNMDIKKIKSIIVNAKIRKREPIFTESFVWRVYEEYVYNSKEPLEIASMLKVDFKKVEEVISCRNIQRKEAITDEEVEPGGLMLP